MPKTYVPRLSVEITDETARRMINLIPWGLRGKVVAILLDDLLDAVERHGEVVLSAIISKAISVKHIMKGIPEDDKN